MIDINFESKLKEISDLIKIWEKRYLTPIGKITIVKTFLMSKLNHLFQTLPTPGQDWLKQLEGMFFKFIWSNMPDKINRHVATLDKKQGGLQMPDLKLFIKSLKATWIGRYFRRGISPWVELLDILTSNNMEKILSLGPDYICSLKNKIKNRFWIDVLDATHDILQHQRFSNQQGILTTPIWYNSEISSETLFLPEWYHKGICSVSDILDNAGEVASLSYLQNKYNIKDNNFLNHLRVNVGTLKFLKTKNY